jgi:hypothetical protein
MATGGKLVVQRKAGGYRDRARSYLVAVDDIEIGSVDPGQTLERELPAGPHRVEARIDWTGSRPVEVSIEAGQVLRMNVEPSGISAFATFFKRSKPYLRLTVVNG